MSALLFKVYGINLDSVLTFNKLEGDSIVNWRKCWVYYASQEAPGQAQFSLRYWLIFKWGFKKLHPFLCNVKVWKYWMNYHSIPAYQHRDTCSLLPETNCQATLDKSVLEAASNLTFGRP